MSCNCIADIVCLECRTQIQWAKIPIDKKIAVLSLARAIQKKSDQNTILKYATAAHPFDCCHIPSEQMAKL